MKNLLLTIALATALCGCDRDCHVVTDGKSYRVKDNASGWVSNISFSSYAEAKKLADEMEAYNKHGQEYADWTNAVEPK